MSQRRAVEVEGRSRPSPDRVGGLWVWSLATAVAVVGFASVSARAQAPAPAVAEPGAAKAAEEPRPVGDLTTRYRFIERYAVGTEKAKPGEIGQYRVASRDVLKAMVETEQGAPKRQETTIQVIYTERPAAVNSSDVVTDTVRRYDAYRVTPAPEALPSAPKPLNGLTVWLHPRQGGSPEVIGLTPDHPLTETEYAINSRLTYLPDLKGVLPSTPMRVGDRWRVPRSANQALLGRNPIRLSEPLVATLTEVRKDAKGTDYVAAITVTGRAQLPPNGLETLLNAQILFGFTPPPALAAPADGADRTEPVNAVGAIIEMRLARSSTSAIAGGGAGSRLRRSLTWEQHLQRQLALPGGELIAAPSSAPKPSESNSWLTYDDPKGRFHFRHPQDLLPKDEPELIEEGTVILGDDNTGAGQGRVVQLILQPKTGDPEKDHNNRDPEFHAKELNDGWAKQRQDVLRGPKGWLPEAEWSPYKMKVFRIEAALKDAAIAAKSASRLYLDYYLVLFSQNESLVIDAMTGQDPPLKFRKDVEGILKTYKLGPSLRPGG